MIALITPTGCRPKQIQLCAKYMRAQDYKGEVMWIIIDDAKPRTVDFITENFRRNWTIIKVCPQPYWRPGQNTQGRNLREGLNIVKRYPSVEAIFIIEDDDYYSPRYLRCMMEKLKGYQLAGERNTIYYNVVSRRWCVNGNVAWSSLFQTAFTPEVIPVMEKYLSGEKFIDIKLFKDVSKTNLFNDGNMAVGIKGLPGRMGIGAGHRGTMTMIGDPNLVKLQELLGEDYKNYDNQSVHHI